MVEQSPDFVQSFARGLSVIRSFSADNPSQTLSEVASQTGLSRATARRFLHTLTDLGYAVNIDSKFQLTPRVLELGSSYLSALSLPAIAQPRLEVLSRQVGESSSMSVLDGTDIIYVCRVPVRRIMTVNITIGTRFPAYATSMGRVILASLPEDELDEILATAPPEQLTTRSLTSIASIREEIVATRERGWALVDQELEPGLRSLAAPITDASGVVVAAINVSTQSASHSVEDIRKQMLPQLLETAQAISTDLLSL
ncbi:transcriptional regulator [Corynebacterium suranareeae]|uniref:Transcriptional regulator n=1 Tax=Corynebacterium suranareeae TaxID=2506452 RepID=A0A160PSK9_9CORY|nr:IclR family transcriptional regulator C-terminal domain-containing protein [Corynebacterium suranareeae]BAU96724.1 transcriptional regulator [Corynebacterium suranareeae]